MRLLCSPTTHDLELATPTLLGLEKKNNTRWEGEVFTARECSRSWATHDNRRRSWFKSENITRTSLLLGSPLFSAAIQLDLPPWFSAISSRHKDFTIEME
ncbi:hypothetical protein L1887_15469 [Cichorium endivia]|nr:hypothetical protein L1887_15469 [Cichorium endivia]